MTPVGMVLWTSGPAGEIYALVPLVMLFIILFAFARLGLRVVNPG